MTISLPGSSRFRLKGRQKASADAKPVARKQLQGEQLARLFDKEARVVKPMKPAKMNEVETRERDRLSSLRGALYSKD